MTRLNHGPHEAWWQVPSDSLGLLSCSRSGTWMPVTGLTLEDWGRQRGEALQDRLPGNTCPPPRGPTLQFHAVELGGRKSNGRGTWSHGPQLEKCSVVGKQQGRQGKQPESSLWKILPNLMAHIWKKFLRFSNFEIVRNLRGIPKKKCEADKFINYQYFAKAC